MYSKIKIFITHGTDTMVDTARTLSNAIEDKTIVFTANKNTVSIIKNQKTRKKTGGGRPSPGKGKP